jgi:hypothetical protein
MRSEGFIGFIMYVHESRMSAKTTCLQLAHYHWPSSWVVAVVAYLLGLGWL